MGVHLISRRVGFMKAVAVICVYLSCIFPLSSTLAGDPLQSSIRLQTEIGRKAIQSQKQVDLLFDEKQRLLQEYKQTRNELQSLQRYDDHLQKMVSAQEQKIIALQQQMEEIDVTHREVIPLMSRMVETLEQFIELDVPFLIEERRHRVKRLQHLLDLPDFSLAEKYRQVMEAYQVETEYGRTIQAYRGTLEPANRARTVDFLRIGRLALIYRSLDGSDSGIWDQKSRSWQRLPDDYQSSLSRGFRVARKQMAPELLKLPVCAPQVLP
jgi:septal ring factor EnvC (AmiA/AmiB activator)